MAMNKIARVSIGLVGACALTVGLAACSDAEPTAASVGETAQSTPSSPDPLLDSDEDGTLDAYDYAPTDPSVQRAEDVQPAAPSTPPASAAPTAAAPAPAPASVQVPDVTGMNYQDAQDLLRANGLAVYPANDGLGANRIPVLDLNWFVVTQDVPPGTTVEAGTGITCTILKYTDR